ncbi:MAG: hypothetical protein JW749_06715 [Sedimentisphaerales bacterium]|nr:hypothetical protein [Sedimentisphaerales bacterium]
MTEKQNNLMLDRLEQVVRSTIKSFAEKLIAGLTDNLESITIVGSALTGDFHPGTSDINIVLVLGRENIDSLNLLASMVRPMRRARVSPPVIMTAEYIERSKDVFGIEFLDFQMTHQTIFGQDPFVNLNFDRPHVRLQCERELKATLIRLRQGYIASSANRRIVQDILISAVRGLAPLLRAMFWLKGIDRPAKTAQLFERSVSEFSIEPVMSTLYNRGTKLKLANDEFANLFEKVYAAVDKLARIVDGLEVS